MESIHASISSIDTQIGIEFRIGLGDHLGLPRDPALTAGIDLPLRGPAAESGSLSVLCNVDGDMGNCQRGEFGPVPGGP
jgi:hypothetical protein